LFGSRSLRSTHADFPPLTNQSDHVDRADKTAPMPEHEEGEAIKGVSASGGQSQGLEKGSTVGQGKGPL